MLITGSLRGGRRARARAGDRAASRRRVDALLIVPAGPRPRATSPRAGPHAVVFLDRPPGGFEADTVLLDNRGGARLAVEHLLAHGHRRIAFVADRSEVYTATERLAGYRPRSRRAGVDLVPALMRPAATTRRRPRRSSPSCSSCLRIAARPRCSPATTATRSARCTRSPARAARSRWSASTTSSSPTCSRPITVMRADAGRLGAPAAALAFARLDGDDRPPQQVGSRPSSSPAAPGRSRRRDRGTAVLPPNRSTASTRRRADRRAARARRSADDACRRTGSARRRRRSARSRRGSAASPTARLVRDVVRADPEALLGAEHVAPLRRRPGLLVKLLDAGERLPVHLHPGREFARARFGSACGKTEAWIIVDAEPGAPCTSGCASR